MQMDGARKDQVEHRRECTFSGREDNIHRHGVAITMTKKAEQTLLEWKSISDRIIYARFFFKYVKLSMAYKSMHQRMKPTTEIKTISMNSYRQLWTVFTSMTYS